MLTTLFLATALLAVPPAQASATSQGSSSAKQEPVTMTGCISRTPTQAGKFTFVDADGGKFRLDGKNIKKFAGKKVEIVGGSNDNALHIGFGLYPSPNIAAQAGAIDPAQAAIAAQPGGGAQRGVGDEIPEFRVNKLKALPGACE